MTESELERRRKISEAAKARHAARIATEPKIEKKRCTRCREFKFTEQFPTRKRNLKSGGVKVYPGPHCFDCDRIYRAENRAKRTPEQLESARRATQRYKKSEKGRRTARDWWRMQHGQGKRVWSKYQHEFEDYRVDAAPFVAWLFDEYLPLAQETKYLTPSGDFRKDDFLVAHGLDDREWKALHESRRAIRNGKDRLVSVQLVERVLVAAGRLDLVDQMCYVESVA